MGILTAVIYGVEMTYILVFEILVITKQVK